MLNQGKQDWKKLAKLQLETSQLLHFSLPIYSHSVPRPGQAHVLEDNLNYSCPLFYIFY